MQEQQPQQGTNACEPEPNQSVGDNLCREPEFLAWSREYNEANKVGRQLLSGTYKESGTLRLPPHYPTYKAEEYWRLHGFEVYTPSEFETAAKDFTEGAVMGPAARYESPHVTLGQIVRGFYPPSGIADAMIGVQQISTGDSGKGAITIGGALITMIPE